MLENDLALGRAALGRTRLPPLSRALSTQLATLGAAAGVVAAAWVAPGLAPRLVQGGVPVWLAAWTPEELIAALLLYHSASWLCRGLARRPDVHGAAFARNAPILLLHSVPLLALAGARELAPARVRVGGLPAHLPLSLGGPRRPHLCRARDRSGVTAGSLQLAAWCAAFWLALWLHARHTDSPRERARFALSLGFGALLARAGHSLLWGDPARMLEPGESFSLLFMPLGVLALIPRPAAFASLPLALALARLGCLPAGCCRGAAGEPLPLFEAIALALLHLFLARGAPEAAAERFAFAFGGLRLAQTPWRPRGGLEGPAALATPELVALGWIGLGMLLVAARRRRRSVTKRQRLAHASGTPRGTR